MDKSSALEKIKKCLALSRSANEHEAAQALKHAQALMAKYGLTGWDIELAEVSEQYGKAPKSAPSWHWRLVHLCGSAFGCDRWHAADRSGGRFVFCGINGRPELAAYAYEVLLRQLKTARREYIKTALTRVQIVRNKTARADLFCAGWVSKVADTVQAFAQTKAETELLERYRTGKYGEFGKAKTRDVKGRTDVSDYWAGQDAAAGVRLDTPLARTEQRQLGV